MDLVPAGERDRPADVVMATLSSFIEHEKQDSHSITETLVEELRKQNVFNLRYRRPPIP